MVIVQVPASYESGASSSAYIPSTNTSVTGCLHQNEFSSSNNFVSSLNFAQSPSGGLKPNFHHAGSCNGTSKISSNVSQMEICGKSSSSSSSSSSSISYNSNNTSSHDNNDDELTVNSAYPNKLHVYCENSESQFAEKVESHCRKVSQCTPNQKPGTPLSMNASYNSLLGFSNDYGTVMQRCGGSASVQSDVSLPSQVQPTTSAAVYSTVNTGNAASGKYVDGFTSSMSPLSSNGVYSSVDYDSIYNINDEFELDYGSAHGNLLGYGSTAGNGLCFGNISEGGLGFGNSRGDGLDHGRNDRVEALTINGITGVGYGAGQVGDLSDKNELSTKTNRLEYANTNEGELDWDCKIIGDDFEHKFGCADETGDVIDENNYTNDAASCNNGSDVVKRELDDFSGEVNNCVPIEPGKDYTNGGIEHSITGCSPSENATNTIPICSVNSTTHTTDSFFNFTEATTTCSNIHFSTTSFSKTCNHDMNDAIVSNSSARDMPTILPMSPNTLTAPTFGSSTLTNCRSCITPPLVTYKGSQNLCDSMLCPAQQQANIASNENANRVKPCNTVHADDTVPNTLFSQSLLLNNWTSQPQAANGSLDFNESDIAWGDEYLQKPIPGDGNVGPSIHTETWLSRSFSQCATACCSPSACETPSKRIDDGECQTMADNKHLDALSPTAVSRGSEAQSTSITSDSSPLSFVCSSVNTIPSEEPHQSSGLQDIAADFKKESYLDGVNLCNDYNPSYQQQHRQKHERQTSTPCNIYNAPSLAAYSPVLSQTEPSPKIARLTNWIPVSIGESNGHIRAVLNESSEATRRANPCLSSECPHTDTTIATTDTDVSSAEDQQPPQSPHNKSWDQILDIFSSRQLLEYNDNGISTSVSNPVSTTDSPNRMKLLAPTVQNKPVAPSTLVLVHTFENDNRNLESVHSPQYDRIGACTAKHSSTTESDDDTSTSVDGVCANNNCTTFHNDFACTDNNLSPDPSAQCTYSDFKEALQRDGKTTAEISYPSVTVTNSQFKADNNNYNSMSTIGLNNNYHHMPDNFAHMPISAEVKTINSSVANDKWQLNTAPIYDSSYVTKQPLICSTIVPLVSFGSKMPMLSSQVTAEQQAPQHSSTVCFPITDPLRQHVSLHSNVSAGQAFAFTASSVTASSLKGSHSVTSLVKPPTAEYDGQFRVASTSIASDDNAINNNNNINNNNTNFEQYMIDTSNTTCSNYFSEAANAKSLTVTRGVFHNNQITSAVTSFSASSIASKLATIHGYTAPNTTSIPGESMLSTLQQRNPIEHLGINYEHDTISGGTSLAYLAHSNCAPNYNQNSSNATLTPYNSSHDTSPEDHSSSSLATSSENPSRPSYMTSVDEVLAAITAEFPKRNSGLANSDPRNTTFKQAVPASNEESLISDAIEEALPGWLSLNMGDISSGTQGISSCGTLTSLSSIEDDSYIDTKELCIQVTNELKTHSIAQTLFAERVLCRSQGTLSDLLRNPKPWDKLKSGRETFRRMRKWLKLPLDKRLMSLNMWPVLRSDSKLNGHLESNSDLLSPALATENLPISTSFQQNLNSQILSQTGEQGLLQPKLEPDLQSTPKKPRLVFTEAQKNTLRAIFCQMERPSKHIQIGIAVHLGLDLSTVQNYFMNARRRRRHGLDCETDYDRVAFNLDALTAAVLNFPPLTSTPPTPLSCSTNSLSTIYDNGVSTLTSGQSTNGRNLFSSPSMPVEPFTSPRAVTPPYGTNVDCRCVQPSSCISATEESDDYTSSSVGSAESSVDNYSSGHFAPAIADELQCANSGSNPQQPMSFGAKVDSSADNINVNSLLSSMAHNVTMNMYPPVSCISPLPQLHVAISNLDQTGYSHSEENGKISGACTNNSCSDSDGCSNIDILHSTNESPVENSLFNLHCGTQIPTFQSMDDFEVDTASNKPSDTCYSNNEFISTDTFSCNSDVGNNTCVTVIDDNTIEVLHKVISPEYTTNNDIKNCNSGIENDNNSINTVNDTSSSNLNQRDVATPPLRIATGLLVHSIVPIPSPSSSRTPNNTTNDTAIPCPRNGPTCRLVQNDPPILGPQCTQLGTKCQSTLTSEILSSATPNVSNSGPAINCVASSLSSHSIAGILKDSTSYATKESSSNFSASKNAVHPAIINHPNHSAIGVPSSQNYNAPTLNICGTSSLPPPFITTATLSGSTVSECAQYDGNYKQVSSDIGRNNELRKISDHNISNNCICCRTGCDFAAETPVSTYSDKIEEIVEAVARGRCAAGTSPSYQHDHAQKGTSLCHRETESRVGNKHEEPYIKQTNLQTFPVLSESTTCCEVSTNPMGTFMVAAPQPIYFEQQQQLCFTASPPFPHVSPTYSQTPKLPYVPSSIGDNPVPNFVTSPLTMSSPVTSSSFNFPPPNPALFQNQRDTSLPDVGRHFIHDSPILSTQNTAPNTQEPMSKVPNFESQNMWVPTLQGPGFVTQNVQDPKLKNTLSSVETKSSAQRTHVEAFVSPQPDLHIRSPVSDCASHLLNDLLLQVSAR